MQGYNPTILVPMYLVWQRRSSTKTLRLHPYETRMYFTWTGVDVIPTRTQDLASPTPEALPTLVELLPAPDDIPICYCALSMVSNCSGDMPRAADMAARMACAFGGIPP